MQISDLKKQQVKNIGQHYKNGINHPEGKEKNKIIQTFIEERPIRLAYSLLNDNLQDKTVLSICAGRGDEAIFLQQQGAKVTATDITPEAIEIIKKKNPEINTSIADAEKLPYADNSFDYVIVKYGLHHLPRPIIGLYEMWRVAKKGIIVIEAQDSWMMNVLLKMKLADRIEPSGNYVYRFTRKEMKKLFATMFVDDIQIHTEWFQYLPVFNKHIYPLLNNRIGFILFRGVLKTFNYIFGYWGNNFIMIVKK